MAGGETPLHDKMRTIPTQGDDAGIHNEVHHRAVQGHERLRLHVQVEKAEGRLVELPHLVMLPHEGLHDADGIDILLHDPVQGIHLEKDPLEEFRGAGDEDRKEHAQHDHRHEEDDTQFLMDEETHPEGRYHVERRPEGSPQQHLERILDAGHVGRHPRHQAGGGELVDIREREPLDVPIHGEAQVRRQAGAAVRCEPTRQDAENETQAGNPHHHRPIAVHIRQAARPDALVDDGRRHIRNQHPHDHFQRGPQGCEQRSSLVLLNLSEYRPEHDLSFRACREIYRIPSASSAASRSALRITKEIVSSSPPWAAEMMFTPYTPRAE